MNAGTDTDAMITPPGERLSYILAKRHAASALLILSQAGPHPLPYTKLGTLMGGQPGSGRAMVEHLRIHGLVSVESGPSPFPGQNTYLTTLTPLGQQLAAALQVAADIVPDDDSGPRLGRRPGRV